MTLNVDTTKKVMSIMATPTVEVALKMEMSLIQFMGVRTKSIALAMNSSLMSTPLRAKIKDWSVKVMKE